MQDVIDLLTQGSVWKKNAGKKAGQQAKVLFVTNTTLPERVRESHPIQVVYADAENNVYSRVVEDFANQYTFFNVDADLETRLESILVFNEEDYEDAESEEDEEDDDAEVSVAETKPAKVEKAQAFADMLLADDEHDTGDETGQDTLEHYETVVQFVMTSGADAPSILSDAELGEAMVAYSQEPLLGRNMIQHKMLFALNSTVTVDTLKATWMPSELRNTVDAFAVVGPHFNEVVAWTDYLGVYPEVAQGRSFATVLVGEEIEVRTREIADEVTDLEQDGASDMTLVNPEQPVVLPNDDLVPPVNEVFIPQMQVVNEPQTQVVTEVPQTVPVEVQRQIADNVHHQHQHQHQQPPAIPSVQQSVQSLVQNLTPNQNPLNPQ